MRYAIPTVNGKLAMHFGHCQQFTLIDVIDGEITSEKATEPPPHEPGVLPDWLASMQVEIVIAGGMGTRAQQLFRAKGIEVLIGAPDQTPAEVVTQHLAGTLATGDNICDH